MEQRFKVGDRVRVAKDVWVAGGMEGVVVGSSDDDVEVEISGWEGGHNGNSGEERNDRWWVAPKNLTLIAPAFKVGDRVRDDETGTAGTIVGDHAGWLWVSWDKNPDMAWPWSADRLRHAPAPLALKPGSRVYITGGAAAPHIGTVIGLNDNAVNVRTDELYIDSAGQMMRHVTVNKANITSMQEAA